VSGPSDQQRRIVLFSGIVQGVGFRYTTVRISSGFDVNGYVMNLPDRRVKLVAEGRPDELDAFLDQVQLAMDRYINNVDDRVSEATGEFDNFQICHGEPDGGE